MALLLQPYQIQKIDQFTFAFNTSKGIEYNCSFVTYAEYFPNHPEVAPYFFAFNLDLKDKKIKLPKGTDKRIADTVISIVGNFLASKTNAVVYVCDNSDGKEAIRARKFLSWFNYIDYPEIMQINNNFKVGGLFIYSAMLIHHKNKRKKEFALAYLELTEGDEK